MDPNEKLSDLERECLSHLLSYLRGLTNAREFWYLVALEQEHFASKDALQMMQHVGKRQMYIKKREDLGSADFPVYEVGWKPAAAEVQP